MLSNVLGVLIAFISIILLLSIVVTALTQATQAAFRVRARNLLTGVSRLLVTTKLLPVGVSRTEKRKTAARILNNGNVATVDKVSNPEGVLRRVILGPRTSWVESRELAAAIHVSVAGPTKDDMPPAASADDPLVKAIKRAEPAWCKRFQYFMRLITIGWSLIVAIGFQVSAPSLFSSLTHDPARTALILGEQEKVTKIAKEALAEDQYDLVSDEALAELARLYPAFADDIAQAGNAAPTKAELLQQLLDVLPDVPERPEVVQTYSKLIDERVTKSETSAIDSADDAVDQLASFGITWWQSGSAYYQDPDGTPNFSIIIGVLITAVLLTFGAPFWFEQLKTLAALRDPRAAAAEARRARELAIAAGTTKLPEEARLPI
jgi:hypothetical protein